MSRNYEEFLKSKKMDFKNKAFPDVSEKEIQTLYPFLFKHQVISLVKALKKGKYALFLDTGLGKTLIFLCWSDYIVNNTGKSVLILAPAATLKQHIKEAANFKIDISLYSGQGGKGIYISNYEQLHNIDTSKFDAVVLDESSILKNFQSKTKQEMIEIFKMYPYKLALTATPSPNDTMELCNHSEFLNVMRRNEMLSMFFVHDGGSTQDWRLKKHAINDFWGFVNTWSYSLDTPERLGVKDKRYILPKLNYINHVVKLDRSDIPEGQLFAKTKVNSTDIHRDLKKTMDKRVKLVAELVNKSKKQWIVWTVSNAESAELKKAINDCVEVKGSDKTEFKNTAFDDFASGRVKVLITKTKIASMGLNFQNAHNMIFASYNFSFEQFYQAVRRMYRFGQSKDVNVHLVTSETQLNVISTIKEKEIKHKNRIKQMSEISEKNTKTNNMKRGTINEIGNAKLIHGDCIKEVKNINENSIDFSIFSPPFADLFTYSNNIEDMGNSKDYKEFLIHFNFLVSELKRIVKPGRNVAVHCMDLAIQKGKEGYIGLRDFSGMILESFKNEGFIYHSRVTIWKNPVTEMQRTKALGLLHKQTKKDSTMSRAGIPDYLLIFRNSGHNEVPVKQQNTDPKKANYLPVDLWQKYASPVWLDINYSDTLNFRGARSEQDEKHICPLQLPTIERAIQLWSNEGETIFTPFMGIGSEVYQAIKMNRKAVGIELKDTYYNQAVKNITGMNDSLKQKTLF